MNSSEGSLLSNFSLITGSIKENSRETNLSIGRDGQLRTSLYDKRDDFHFHITNFTFLSSNIPSLPAYDVFISQLILYARGCSSFECSILRAVRLSCKPRGQGYVRERLKPSFRKFYGRYGILIKHYEAPLSQMLHEILWHDHKQWHPPLIRHFTKSWPCYRTGPYCRFDVLTLFPRFPGHLQRVWLANRGRLLLRTPGPVPCVTCICSKVETIFSWTCHVYGHFEFRTSFGTSILLKHLIKSDSVTLDFLPPKFTTANTKQDDFSIFMTEYTYMNMYIFNYAEIKLY